MQNKYEENMLIDIQLKHSRDVLDAKQKELKSKGKDNKPNKAEGFTAEKVYFLYSKGQFGTSK